MAKNPLKEAQRKLKEQERKLKAGLKDLEEQARESLQVVANQAAVVYVKESDNPNFDDCVLVAAAACAAASAKMGAGTGPWGAAGAAALGAGAGIPLAKLACRQLFPDE